MCGPDDSLFTQSWLFTRPLFQHFSVLKTLLSPPNHKFWEILNSKALKLAKSSDLELQIGLKFSSQSYILLRNSVYKGPKFGSGPFTSPSVDPFGPHTYTKMKVKCPPPHQWNTAPLLRLHWFFKKVQKGWNGSNGIVLHGPRVWIIFFYFLVSVMLITCNVTNIYQL